MRSNTGTFPVEVSKTLSQERIRGVDLCSGKSHGCSIRRLWD